MLRLRAIDAMVFRTDTSGHVRAVSDGKTVDVLEGTLAELGPGPVERDRSGQDELVLSGPDPGYDRAVRKKRKARKKGRGKDVLERRPSRGAEDQPWR